MVKDSLYDEASFERRFECPRSVVPKLLVGVMGHELFVQKVNRETGELDIRPRLRFVVVMCILKYGNSADYLDEHLYVSQSSLTSSLKYFCIFVIEKIGADYLNRNPTVEEKSQETTLMGSKGFPSYFALWNCTYFVWKMCPTRLTGQYKGKEKGKNIVLEVICNPHIYMFYFHWGEVGSLNDLSILERSNIVGSILNQTFETRVEPYIINGTRQDWVYFLVDGIHPPMSIFTKTIADLKKNQEHRYLKYHEYARKGIKYFFGELVSKFEILGQPFRK